MQIKKRDGRVKPFETSKITNAIMRAYDECYPACKNEATALQITMNIIDKLNKSEYTVEEIQDIVIEEVNKVNEVVGKAYEKYRNMRTEEREKNSKKERFYREILHCTNVDNDNANVDQYSFSGRKYRIADAEQKSFALRNLISEKGRDAFEKGALYYHDLSSYAIGEHNCMFTDNAKLINETGFKTRNGDVRPANSFSTACQQLAVIFQIQSQVQFGGVASLCTDFELEKAVHKSFVKHFKDGRLEKEEDFIVKGFISDNEIHIDSKRCKEWYPKAYDYAIRHLEKEGSQAAQGLYHNLNTLESRAGSQVPFTSLNFGRNTTTYGRLINKWLLDASIEGIGKFNRTSIFPIGIFQYKKGVNDKEGTPNYDLKMKAIESMCKRIYPNWANGDWKQNIEDPDDYRTYFGTMGKLTAPIYQ